MMLRRSAVYAALALLAACHRPDVPSLVRSAQEHVANREYTTAIIELKNALQKEPNNVQARYLLGIASLENGDFNSAYTELSKAKKSGYAGIELEVALARTLLGQGEYERLVGEYRQKKLPSPQLHAELQATLGAAYLALKRVDDAQAALREAAGIDPGNATAHVGLARLAALTRDYPAALAEVERALSASPLNAEALMFKGDLLAAQGQDPAAENAYRAALKAPVAQFAARLGLIELFVRQGSLDKAANEVAALERLSARDGRTLYAKAWVLAEQRNYPAAHELILQVLKSSPDHEPSLMIAGGTAFAMGSYAEAESHFRKVVQRLPQSVLAKRWLAATHLRMGQTDLALTEVREVLTRAGDDPAVAALAGEVSLATGDVVGAARHYEKAKSLAPNNAAVQTRLAVVRVASGDAERGLKELQASAAAHPDDYQADLALVTTYLRQRQADKALEAVNGLEKKQPNNPLTSTLRGQAQLLKRDYAGARASFERSLQLNPSYMPAVQDLAQLDLRDKQPDVAKKRYETILKREPNNEQALAGLAVLLRITGAPKEEIEKQLKQAVAGNPTSPSARISLVNFYLTNADFARAVNAAQDAQVALPNSVAIAEKLGATLLAAGETEQAIGAFQNLVQMAPKAPQPLVHLARAQLAARKPNDAIASLRAALALNPDLVVVERDIPTIYMSAGRYDLAWVEARNLQRHHPDQPFGFMLEGEIYLAQQKLDAAERAYRTALARFDAPVLAMRTHNIMTARRKDLEADAMVEKWIASHPKDTSVVLYLAQRDLGDRRYGEAQKRYAIALERDPDNALVLNNLAWVSSQLKQPKAREYAERAHQLAPENATVMDTLGWILVQAGDLERGLQLLGRAAELAPQAYDIRLNFAKALAKAGRKDAARKELEPLAKLDTRLPVQKEAAALLGNL